MQGQDPKTNRLNLRALWISQLLMTRWLVQLTGTWTHLLTIKASLCKKRIWPHAQPLSRRFLRVLIEYL